MQKVAIQGYTGCFHHIAANMYFGRDIDILPCDTFRLVAEAVKKGEANMGLMAIENSIAGSIIPNYKILQDSNLQVAGEVLDGMAIDSVKALPRDARNAAIRKMEASVVCVTRG